MADQVRKRYPAVKGLTWHRDQYYSFFVPEHWHKLEWSDDRTGVIYAPDPADLLTVFAVDIRDLGTNVVAGDLDAVAEGFFSSLEQLPACKIESREQKVGGDRLKLEAHYTFCDGGATRRCWVRVFYHETRQIAMTAQGATLEKYQYWLPWFYEAMETARIHKEKPHLDYVF